MQVNPYLSFNGNCTEAVALYEKAFNTKAVIEYSNEEKTLVAHAEFKIGNDIIMLYDAAEEIKIGNNIMISVRFDEHELAEARSTFDILKTDGNCIMELGETSWSKCFGLLVDKFGIQWNICQN